MDEIRELDQTTIERIAAGEVVERPASVVKELLENSLDADASRVRVAVEAGGTESIRVSDDGVGMTEGDARAAVREHTTSKIRDISDLESGVGTLGFRGEALHAISAVSRMTITTRPRGGDRGTRLRVEGGEVTTVEAAGCPEGTTVEIADLFYNVPARRKYLSRDATEFDHVNTVVRNYALANPAVAVALEHDGRETFATTGGDSLRETVMAVYGREVAESMIDVDARELPAGPLDAIDGLVSHPETNRADREYVATFVNGRYVRSSAARNAIVEAYGNQLSPDRYPFAVLDLSLPAGTVDVNVHPRKMEVRFADEAGLREQVRAAVEETLLENGLIRSGAPRGQSAPEQTEIDPTATTPDSGVSTSESSREESESEPSIAKGTNDASRPSGSDQSAEPTPAASKSDASQRTESEHGFTKAPNQAETDTEPERRTGRTQHGTEPDSAAPPAETGSPASAGHGEGTSQGSGEPERRGAGDAETAVVDAGSQTRLESGEEPLEQTFDSLPSMRVLGQFQETYVVAETDTGLVLIDQHAADERINYERLRDAFAGETTTQALAQPVEIDLTARESSLFEDFQAALARLGFSAERVDDRTVAVTTVPSLVAETADPELLRDVLSSFVDSDSDPGATVEAAAEAVLADLACYPSITGNTSLTEGSIVDLLERLEACENPYACPHGRPVVVEIDADELAERFERDYPGHTTRRLD
ncbi:DNA mismatch repair protein MutL [Halorhabdus utahensis DSM 12940]|uniref:DNA mismatch repair protein MutL n=1 Tax=Halorhabdus utahensis (strain DSM 12940 / JCM 11049 / AX-2) TaxID=519442 RepID=C7NNG9_HALUD|nr:DNA mismatch repair endonuclease MutL [Halorhabdus utahensis]ACV10197.1 DNA mismatch repair protein MutL [Halorhabdus utahensis DSM 12940]